MLYIAVGILGATVMPHNLYLHSAIVQTRQYERTPDGKREAIKYCNIDSAIALTFAFFVNAAILIVAAAVFYRNGHHEVAEITDAYKLLSPLLGVTGASMLFAVALLASGQNSTLTGTLAGQIVMEGFLNIRLKPWLRRLVTRLIAIIPAIIVSFFYGESGTAKLLIFSQVVLSMQLSFAVFPLVAFTSDKAKMGEFVNGAVLKFVELDGGGGDCGVECVAAGGGGERVSWLERLPPQSSFNAASESWCSWNAYRERVIRDKVFPRPAFRR